LFVRGGEGPEVKRIPVGLLGADYKVENGRYRFARVYDGENWNPQLHAPLTQPGVNVVEGEYLLAVNGREVRGSDEVYSFFEETAGKSTLLRVGPNADGSGSREVSVVPVESEMGLRELAWVEGNRRKVEELSKGRLAYIYLPDTASGGYTYFNRYFFSQAGKDGAVVDERFNGGGTNTDYILDYLRRTLMNYRTTRDGEDMTTPVSLIRGPKAMIINEYAGSGGDAMPWHFRKWRITESRRTWKWSRIRSWCARGGTRNSRGRWSFCWRIWRRIRCRNTRSRLIRIIIRAAATQHPLQAISANLAST
jgi:tricorn protease